MKQPKTSSGDAAKNSRSPRAIRNEKALPALPDADLFADAGLAAAGWFRGSQVVMQRPFWDANHGRFFYNRHVPSGETILGINWTQARGIMVLLSASEYLQSPALARAAGRRDDSRSSKSPTDSQASLTAALRAAQYLTNLQVYDHPEDPRRQFAFRECIPQVWWCHTRDAVEACLGMLFLHRFTGLDEYRRRATDFCKWFQRNAWDGKGWPKGTLQLDKPRDPPSPIYSFQAGDAAMFYYLWKATGRRSYLAGLKQIADETLRRFVQRDGSLRTKTLDAHHTLPKGTAGLVINDDGTMVSMLCAHRALHDERYLDACIRHAGWIMRELPMPIDVLSAMPCLANFMIELSTVTGDATHRAWAANVMREHVLPLQIRDASAGPMALGAFRGEDEPIEWYGPKLKTTPKTDFITTRVTCYAALACFKLAGLELPYYGATGWDRPAPKIRDWPDLTI